MIHTDMPNKKIHQGRNIKRFREMLGIKQDALAYELGEDWNQKKISLLEQKESVEKDILEQVAKILKVPTEAIENFDEEQAINIIGNTITNNDNAAVVNNYPTFHPVESILKLHEEKIALYERMLKEKDEMMARLEKLIEKK
ncbi:MULTISPECIES: helix-turn-helix domain-containing protein [Elizabethkingia]|uniref:helix-turn-helix domain-containing protein n=1 Tax=Elizabethkingia TaxID=308865 RepID=UPI0021A8290C|nr:MULTISPECIES: helix-turn-helix transcriptional regulator [Elizabethkingia]MCT3686568.1 helix-turn-helix transcriptional regulator [Elizabethkingia anophelis]MCT3704607.1 helix-turn-helix transcriptional regulator [Elizabethkingia anophelis]MCT3711626.1 helix-turn-helix transcriptional regulator [Elizabethkingia anophelis]MCT3715985.1 helix-turn-helix transcriptional regulator [Elizabethkingia anophelis]MCT3729167.1 helix-turn-helix transcriptional regulator [Elizabethkingia anophelis]